MLKNSATNNAISSENSTQVEEFEMVELLAHHFGDGIVYLPAGEQNSLYSVAVENEYISEEGYLTRKGRIFLAQYSDSEN